MSSVLCMYENSFCHPLLPVLMIKQHFWNINNANEYFFLYYSVILILLLLLLLLPSPTHGPLKSVHFVCPSYWEKKKNKKKLFIPNFVYFFFDHLLWPAKNILKMTSILFTTSMLWNYHFYKLQGIYRKKIIKHQKN